MSSTAGATLLYFYFKLQAPTASAPTTPLHARARPAGRSGPRVACRHATTRGLLRYMGTHHDALDIVAAGPMHVPGTTP